VLAIAALVLEHPIVLAGLAATILAAAAAARVGRDVTRVMLFALPLAILWACINPFFVSQGLTVFARLGDVPPFGYVDLTLEAVVYGWRQGLRIVLVIVAFALMTATVDPDELLRLFRRLSFRSALSATLATRMVPVLSRDARRMVDARRCRADGGGSGRRAQVAVVRALLTGALDRSLDVAATLEVRGYGSGRRLQLGRAPWSRHDFAFLVSAFAIAALTALSVSTGLGSFDPYDLDSASLGAGELALTAAIALAALLPFAERRGIEP
jgi:energy-coupling factor transport system permease protein